MLLLLLRPVRTVLLASVRLASDMTTVTDTDPVVGPLVAAVPRLFAVTRSALTASSMLNCPRSSVAVIVPLSTTDPILMCKLLDDAHAVPRAELRPSRLCALLSDDRAVATTTVTYTDPVAAAFVPVASLIVILL